MHSKRIATGYGKASKWVTTPRSPHAKADSVPLLSLVRDYICYADNAREARKIIVDGSITVDGVVRRDPSFGVGALDILLIPALQAAYRIVPGQKGLRLQPVDKAETHLKPRKVTGKRVTPGGKIQYSFHDGYVIASTKGEYKVKDTVVFDVSTGHIKHHIPFAEGKIALVTHGRHKGQVGAITSIIPSTVTRKSLTSIGSIQTLTDYIILVGDDKTTFKLN
ncbi:30S ribosomal protein S4e [uncultured archaeon]|nr:30S ribosomal protein S4e [uncultured archaeon]